MYKPQLHEKVLFSGVKGFKSPGVLNIIPLAAIVTRVYEEAVEHADGGPPTVERQGVVDLLVFNNSERLFEGQGPVVERHRVPFGTAEEGEVWFRQQTPWEGIAAMAQDGGVRQAIAALSESMATVVHWLNAIEDAMVAPIPLGRAPDRDLNPEERASLESALRTLSGQGRGALMADAPSFEVHAIAPPEVGRAIYQGMLESLSGRVVILETLIVELEKELVQRGLLDEHKLDKRIDAVLLPFRTTGEAPAGELSREFHATVSRLGQDRTSPREAAYLELREAIKMARTLETKAAEFNWRQAAVEKCARAIGSIEEATAWMAQVDTELGEHPRKRDAETMPAAAAAVTLPPAIDIDDEPAESDPASGEP
jgi:hypothetical protein